MVGLKSIWVFFFHAMEHTQHLFSENVLEKIEIFSNVFLEDVGKK